MVDISNVAQEHRLDSCVPLDGSSGLGHDFEDNVAYHSDLVGDHPGAVQGGRELLDIGLPVLVVDLRRERMRQV